MGVCVRSGSGLRRDPWASILVIKAGAQTSGAASRRRFRIFSDTSSKCSQGARPATSRWTCAWTWSCSRRGLTMSYGANPCLVGDDTARDGCGSSASLRRSGLRLRCGDVKPVTLRAESGRAECLKWVDTVEKVRRRLKTRKLRASREVPPQRNQSLSSSQRCQIGPKRPSTAGSRTFSTVSVERGHRLISHAGKRLS